MKHFATLCFLALAAIVLVYFGRNWMYIIPSHGSASLMAGQAVRLDNSSDIEIEVRSQFPVSIQGIGCSAPRVVEQAVDCGPGPITIRDFRPTLLVWAQSNPVSWTTRMLPILRAPPALPMQTPVQPTASDSPLIEAKPVPDHFAIVSSVPQPEEKTQPEKQSDGAIAHNMIPGETRFSLQPGEKITFASGILRTMRFEATNPVSVKGGDCDVHYASFGSCHNLTPFISISNDESSDDNQITINASTD